MTFNQSDHANDIRDFMIGLYINSNDIDANCPVCPAHEQTYLMDLIMHLNDECGWSFDRIADWLEETGNDFEVAK